MISESYDFHQFARAVEGRSQLDIVQLAEQEATEAWLRSYQKESYVDSSMETSLTYQRNLLALIDYLRFNIKRRDIADHEFQIFHLISESTGNAQYMHQ